MTSIGNQAFYYCEKLSSIIIPASVTTINGYAFQSCYSLTIYCEVSTIPSGWHTYYWNYNDRPVYWAGQWEYDADGNPVPLK